MVWAIRHKVHGSRSGCSGPRCINSTAYNRDPLRHNARIPLHSMTLHVIHCYQSGCILPGFMECTAFNHAAWIPLLSIMIQLPPRSTLLSFPSLFRASTAFHRDPLRHNAWNPVHSMKLHGIHCIQSGCFGPGCITSSAFNHPEWSPMHTIGMQFTTLHGVHCIQSRCMESTAFNRDALGHAA